MEVIVVMESDNHEDGLLRTDKTRENIRSKT